MNVAKVKKTAQRPVTLFQDMHSGGRCKEEPFEHIYIEAPEAEAKVIFYNKFGHNPDRVTCTCCGNDYSIGEYESLAQATAYERNCEYDKKRKCWVERKRTSFGNGEHMTVAKYLKRKDVLLILHDDILPEWRVGEVPQQGYVWVGE